MLPDEYYAKAANDKAAHWVGLLYQQMRWAGESGTEEITILNRVLLDQMRGDEPQIDALMPAILTSLAMMWLEQPAKFISKVNEQMGSGYSVDQVLAARKLGARKTYPA